MTEPKHHLIERKITQWKLKKEVQKEDGLLPIEHAQSHIWKYHKVSAILLQILTGIFEEKLVAKELI